jgi:carboxylesterase
MPIIPAAEPFLFPGNKTGIILSHGFTGTPKEMRWMGEYLNAQGYTCLGVRLSGHATDPEDLIRSHYTDWMTSFEDAYHLLSGLCDDIYLAGLSMGGVLALLMSTKLNVKGVIAMSTPYKLPDDPRLRHIEWISTFVKYMPKSSEEPGSNWFDKTAWHDHISYPENPVRSIAELNKLIGEMQSALPLINVPVLLIHSRDDDYVVKNSMDLIYDDLTTPIKEKVWIEGSGHVITRDAARDQVFKLAHNFIQRIETHS